MRASAALAAAVAAAPAAAPAALLADQAVDLSIYDCTRLDDGRTARADDLARAGFRIVSVGRFGQPNVMMADPASKVRANCIARAKDAR